jgi:hypothetical protein
VELFYFIILLFDRVYTVQLDLIELSLSPVWTISVCRMLVVFPPNTYFELRNFAEVWARPCSVEAQLGIKISLSI